MSQIVMCDGCGAITMEPASQVLVRPRVSIVDLPSDSRTGYQAMQDGYVKDFCSTCTEAILSPKKMQVLEMKENGDL